MAETLPRAAWPTWARRSTIGLVVVAALAIAYLVNRDVPAADQGTGGDAAIVRLFPAPDAQALRQTEVGADLVPGYDGRLVVNGIPIPEEQLEGARDPESISADDLRRNGLRPNNRNRVIFRPGPGKVIEEFPQGRVDVTLTYFEERQEGTARTVKWSIRVD